MCGIAGAIHRDGKPVPKLDRVLRVMNELQKHRGPDGLGQWQHPRAHLGVAHRRLSIIDLAAGQQPMTDGHGNWVTFNGEIYNYVELRQELGVENFTTNSDTEVILLAYRKWGVDCVSHFRGMFAFALWDEATQTLFCARDRFGIKPFYYTIVDSVCYFASETKALLPFVPKIETDLHGFQDYLTFQLCLDGKTLFRGIHELLPAHTLTIKNGNVTAARYWQVYYDLDLDHSEHYFQHELERLLVESIHLHQRADVPVGAYLSGGLDSSIVSAVASRHTREPFEGFTGKFTLSERYDESEYARAVARDNRFQLYEIDITCADFINNIEKVIYHLDYPVAGPGSFPQYMTSQLAATRRKVVLGGQGGDEIFGGYARYLIAYFEQCIKAAIDGTMHNGNFLVTYESIIPNLVTLREYKPLLQEFWRDGLFQDLDRRYFRLINRAPSLGSEIRWESLQGYDVYGTFSKLFRANNVRQEAYFDLMTHFDFKTLLPGLLQVEDRVSMAHGLESRVPFLDHEIVEFAARIPPTVKFKAGSMKDVLKGAMGKYLPDQVLNRKDKMGFPVPLTEWLRGDAKPFVRDLLSTQAAKTRSLVDNAIVVDKLDAEPQFSRKIWGLLSLEIWQQQFHDRQSYYQQLLND